MPKSGKTAGTKGSTTPNKTNVENQLLRKQLKLLESMSRQLTEVSQKVDVVIQNSAAGDGKRRKKPRDPNAPKKSKNGYMFFCQDNRERVKKEHPGIDGKEIVKHLSKEWNGLSDKQKAPYQKKANSDKDRYQQEMKTYTASQTTGGDE